VGQSGELFLERSYRRWSIQDGKLRRAESLWLIWRPFGSEGEREGPLRGGFAVYRNLIVDAVIGSAAAGEQNGAGCAREESGEIPDVALDGDLIVELIETSADQEQLRNDGRVTCGLRAGRADHFQGAVQTAAMKA